MTLPLGWVLTTLGEATKPSQKRVQPQNHPNLPYIGMENIEPHTMQLLGVVPSIEMRSTADSFLPGDVLYGRLRPYLNKVYCPDFVGLCSTEFIIFRKVPNIISRYLQYFLNSTDFVTFANSLNAGDRPRVKFEQLSHYPFPLPPLPEQERIVERIESLFTQLDVGVAALKRAQATLKRYKASVLKAACEGHLVSQEISDEPAEELLKRILAKKGKEYCLPEGILTELPRGWVWAMIEQIADSIQYGYTESAKLEPIGPKLLRITDIQNNRVNWDTVPYCICSDDDFKKYKLYKGDIVFTRTGATTGKSFLISECPDAVFASYLIRLRLFQEIERKYFANFLDSPYYWAQITAGKKGSAQPGVNATVLATLTVPLPPTAEQYRIVAEVERRLSVVEELEQTIEANLKRASRLRQAILKRAFEGRLVAQNELTVLLPEQNISTQ
jgi:type I restriction enzyme S subunit